MSGFYQKILMEHFKHPQNKKKIEHPDFHSRQENPSCGDKVSIFGKIKNNEVIDIGFDGSGCVISMATASILTEECKGKTVDMLLELTKDDILQMIGLQLGPNRLRCALLPLEALRGALLEYKNEHKRG